MLNPILASSALRRMRSVRTIVIIGVYVAVLMALLCLGMSTFVFGSTFYINSMSAGITTYCLLMAAQFALIVLVAPAMTAGSIAGERERQTLELLLVTNTGSLSIVFGKLMESFAFLALLIFSGLPVMCLTMLLGGISILQILTGMLFLMVCAFAAACVGILCSSFMKNTVAATIISYVLILLIGIGTIIPLLTSIDKKSITDILYDNAAYAAMSQMDGFRMMPKLLLVNPGVGLISLIEDQTAFIQQNFAGGHGRLYATFLMMKKIGYNIVPFINMAFMVITALVLLLLAARLVRPRHVRIRRKV